jgi:haloacetate dehalogenase
MTQSGLPSGTQPNPPPGEATLAMRLDMGGYRPFRPQTDVLGSSSVPCEDGMSDLGLECFDYATVEAGGSTYRVGTTGEGPAVLLLHGFPQYHYCWRRVVPGLSGDYTVIVCDLKGCGEARAPEGGLLGEGYTKREIGAELVDALGQIGFEHFSVVGHDRGGRVAYRMALDYPDKVRRLTVLNIMPTLDQFERMSEHASLDYYPWYFLAQPPPLPERLIGASADYFVCHTIESWAGDPAAIDADALARYVRAFTPETIAAWCSDYRAAFHLDRQIDAADRGAGRRIGCPVLVHWGAEEGAMSDGPLDVWRRWADRVDGAAFRCGHFIPEEAPDELAASLARFLAVGRA